MPFPVTPVLDQFTGTGALSANWTAPAYAIEVAAQRFSSVLVAPLDTFGSGLWDAATFGPDSEAYASVPAGSTSILYAGLYCKVKSPDTAFGCNYNIFWDFDLNYFGFGRKYIGGDVALGNVGLALAAGNKIGMRVKTAASDIIIEAWSDSGSGWTLRSSYTDLGAALAYPDLASDGGMIGVSIYGNGLASTLRSLDDFGGGTVPPPQLMVPMGMLGTGRI